MKRLEVLAAETYVSPRERHLTDRESRVRSIAYALKTPGSGAEHEAALAMARLVPAGAALVPIPSSSGSLDANASLAQALAQLTDGVLVPALQRAVPVEASHARRRRGERGLTPEAHAASFFLSVPLPCGRPVVLVDNVVTTGATLEGAWRAMGSPPGVIGVAYARANEVIDVQQNPPRHVTLYRVADAQRPFMGPGSYWAERPEDALAMFPGRRLPPGKASFRRVFRPRHVASFATEIEYAGEIERRGFDPFSDEPGEDPIRGSFVADGVDWIRRPVELPSGAWTFEWIKLSDPGEAQQNPPAWLGKLASWTAVGAVSDMLLGPIQRAVAGGTERAVVAMNPDDDLRALERRARASGDLNDALALYGAELRVGHVAQAPWIAIEHVKGVTDEIARRMDDLGLTRTYSAHPAFDDRFPEHAYVSMTAEGRDGRDEDGAIEVEVRLFLLSGVWTARCTTFTNSFRRVTGVTSSKDRSDQAGVLLWSNQAVQRWVSSRRRRRPPAENPIRARFGSDRDPVDVYGPAFPGSVTYWDAKFVDGGERGYLGATDLYDKKGRRWLDPAPPAERPAWKNPPQRCLRNPCPVCLLTLAAGAYGALRSRHHR